MTPRFGALALLSMLLFAGCPRPAAQKPPPPAAEEVPLRAEVQRLAQEAESLLRAQNELIWATWTAGQKPRIAASYEGHQALFTPESIRKIERLRQLSKDPVEIRALTSLLSHFVGEHLASQLSELTDAVANLEASATFTAAGKEHSYRDLERLLAAERSAVKRRALYQGATSAVQRLSATVRRREERKAELVAALGYPSYEAYSAELRQVDPAQLALLAEQVLAVTETAYEKVLERMASQEVGLPRDQLRRADFPRLFRTPPVDARFPAAEILPRAERTLEGMGVRLLELKNVQIDARDVPGKSSRALAVGVDVPADVRLSVRPVAGVRAQAAALGEVGRALHLAFTKPALRFELRALGDGSAAAAYAFLFEDLVEDPIWLEEHAGFSGDALDRYLSTQAAILLQRIRVTAGRILYELQLRRRGLQDARELYGPIMSRAYGVPFDPDDEERALVELEDFYQSANFLAWFLAGQIQAQMKARFGPAWWHNPAAAAFLEGLWGRGQSVTAREAAALIGEERLRPDVLLLRLSTMLKVPISVPADFGREVEAISPMLPAAPDAGVPDAG